jgi:ABC-type ATPase involved in cell division
MTLIAFNQVSKRFATGRRENIALRDVSLHVERSELVAVYGLRRSGRTTLLRVAAGIEKPDQGTVTFDGQDLGRCRDGILGQDIAYANTQFMPSQGGTVLEQVTVGLLAHGIPLSEARVRAARALDRVDASIYADLDPRLLDPAELVRIGLARALVTVPRLLLIDDPINGVDLLQRDPILALIRSIARAGIAVLMTVSDVVTVADRLLSIDGGVLRGDVVPRGGHVVELSRKRRNPSG